MQKSSYKSWEDMKKRCDNPNRRSYKNYGGRGIKYQEDWKYFENFYRDMGDRPDGHTLERIEVDGNYTKENCKWATWEEQANNKTDNVRIDFYGENLTVEQWNRVFELPPSVLRKRRYRKWSVERMMTTPNRHPKVKRLSKELGL